MNTPKLSEEFMMILDPLIRSFFATLLVVAIPLTGNAGIPKGLKHLAATSGNKTAPDRHARVSRPTNSEQGEDGDFVLPGFSAIDVRGTVAHLYARTYEMGNGYLPQQITSRGGWIVRDMRLVAVVDGQEIVFRPEIAGLMEEKPQRVTWGATGEAMEGLRVTARTELEYDGVAQVELVLRTEGVVTLKSLDFVVIVKDAPSMQVLGFRAKGIRRQKDRNDLLTVPYVGPFINVLGFADGQRSFWWFADNAEGWLSSGESTTRIVRTKNDALQLRIRLIADSPRLNSENRFRFNFLVTPVRELGAVGRAERVAIGPVSAKMKERNETFKLWWPTGFAYDAFPYTDYPEGTKEKLTRSDINAYPGRASNRRMVVRDRELYGVHWIPYTSLHALSTLDPILDSRRTEWEVHPRKVFRGGVNPYSDKFEKPVLTHRAAGYSSYLLQRLSQEIENLRVSGFYFDHGPPVNSRNPDNGAWQDSSGATHGSLDILAIRRFLKQLREAFYRNGLDGHIFVHTSNREIIPAYTFAAGLVDGEQYRHRLNHGDYIGAISLDEFRTRFAPHQYGIPIIWLDVEKSHNKGDPTWPNSERQRRAYRNMQAIALLHDVPDRAQGAHRGERDALLRVLDDFGIANAEFTGYWNGAIGISSNDRDVKISTYRNDERTAILAVVTNLSRESRAVELIVKEDRLGLRDESQVVEVRTPAGRILPSTSSGFKTQVRGRDFRLFILEPRLN